MTKSDKKRAFLGGTRVSIYDLFTVQASEVFAIFHKLFTFQNLDIATEIFKGRSACNSLNDTVPTKALAEHENQTFCELFFDIPQKTIQSNAVHANLVGKFFGGNVHELQLIPFSALRK